MSGRDTTSVPPGDIKGERGGDAGRGFGTRRGGPSNSCSPVASPQPPFSKELPVLDAPFPLARSPLTTPPPELPLRSSELLLRARLPPSQKPSPPPPSQNSTGFSDNTRPCCPTVPPPSPRRPWMPALDAGLLCGRLVSCQTPACCGLSPHAAGFPVGHLLQGRPHRLSLDAARSLSGSAFSPELRDLTHDRADVSTRGHTGLRPSTPRGLDPSPDAALSHLAGPPALRLRPDPPRCFLPLTPSPAAVSPASSPLSLPCIVSPSWRPFAYRLWRV